MRKKRVASSKDELKQPQDYLGYCSLQKNHFAYYYVGEISAAHSQEAMTPLCRFSIHLHSGLRHLFKSFFVQYDSASAKQVFLYHSLRELIAHMFPYGIFNGQAN